MLYIRYIQFLIVLLVLNSCRQNILQLSDESICIDSIGRKQFQPLKIEDSDSLKTLTVKGSPVNLPENSYQVTFPYSGTIRKVVKKAGDRVNKGEVLAIVENPYYLDIKSEYLLNKSEAEYLKLNLQRQGELVIEQATSVKKLEEAQKQYELAEIKVKTLGEKLKLMGIDPKNVNLENLNSTCYIYSPAEGTIFSEDCTPGKYFTEKDILFSLSISNNQIFKFDLPTDLLDLKNSSAIKLCDSTSQISNIINGDSLIYIELKDPNKSDFSSPYDFCATFRLNSQYLAIPKSWLVAETYLIIQTDKTFTLFKIRIFGQTEDKVILLNRDIIDKVVVQNAKNLARHAKSY